MNCYRISNQEILSSRKRINGRCPSVSFVRYIALYWLILGRGDCRVITQRMKNLPFGVRTFNPAQNSSLLLARTQPIQYNSIFSSFMTVRSMGYQLSTKTSVKKRFRVNCNGVVKRAQSNKRHIATKKSRERLRRLSKNVLVTTKKIRKNIISMLRS